MAVRYRKYAAATSAIDALNDEELLLLHQDVSRRAQRIRLGTSKYQDNYRAGMAAARGRVDR